MSRTRRLRDHRIPEFSSMEVSPNSPRGESVAPEIFSGLEPGFRIEIDRPDLRRERDEHFLRYFMAACVLIMGAAATIPAVLQWLQIRGGDEVPVYPRWIWMLGFAGALHGVYAVYLALIEDYSALRALAVFFLVMACVCGFFGAALWLGSNTGIVAGFLQIASVQQSRGAAWCGVLAGIASLAAYLFGRETIVCRERLALKSRSEGV